MQIDYLNYALGIAGLVLAIIGIVLSVRSIKKKELVYSIKSNIIISDFSSEYEDLRIIYKTKEVTTVTVSKVLFYNRGAETIRQQDLMTKNHFSISSESEILDARIARVNYIYNNVRLQHLNNSKDVYIDFDYLDQNQGAIIQIIHTGSSSDSLSVFGSVIGMKEPIEIIPEQLIVTPSLDKISKVGLYISIAIALAGYYLLNFQRAFIFSISNSTNIFVGTFSFILTIAILMSWAILALFLIAYLRIIVYSSKTIPKDLQEFMN